MVVTNWLIGWLARWLLNWSRRGLLLMDKLEQLGLPVSDILKLLLIRIIGLVNCLVGPSVVKMNSTGKLG